MDFAVLLVLVVPIMAYFVWLLRTALRTGVLDTGRGRVTRAEHPRSFRISIVLLLLTMVMAAFMIALCLFGLAKALLA